MDKRKKGVRQGEQQRVVGIKYEKGKGLPRVILKGQGYIADEMLKRRDKHNGPPLVKDEKLVQQLYRLPIDGEIGRDLFELVAILLVHVYAVEKTKQEETQ